MAHRAAREHAAELVSQQTLLNSGRRQMRICMVLLATLILLNLVVPIVVGSSAAFRVQSWIQSIWLAGLCYWTYAGHTWARVLLAIPVLMSIIAYLTLLQRQGATASAGLIAYMVVSLGCALAIFWFLVGSRNVRYFLAAQRQPPGQ
jgi:hypothetical protein